MVDYSERQQNIKISDEDMNKFIEQFKIEVNEYKRNAEEMKRNIEKGRCIKNVGPLEHYFQYQLKEDYIIPIQLILNDILKYSNEPNYYICFKTDKFLIKAVCTGYSSDGLLNCILEYHHQYPEPIYD